MPKAIDRSPWWLALAGAIVGGLIAGGFNYIGHQRNLDANGNTATERTVVEMAKTYMPPAK